MELQSTTALAFNTPADYLNIISAVNQEAMLKREEKKLLSVCTSERPGKKQALVMLLLDGTLTEGEDITDSFIGAVMETLEKRHDISSITRMGTTIIPT